MAELRASDDDRERAATRIRDNYGAGRLSDEELAARIEQAYTATTVAELDRLTSDLPGAPSPAPVVRSSGRRVQRSHRRSRGGAFRASVRIHAFIYVMVNLFLIGIWAASGGGYFWPIWSMLGWGIGLGGHAAPLVAGVGRRSSRHDRDALEAMAGSVDAERPSLAPATAPDGTVTILFSDIEASTELNESLGDVRWLELLRVHHALVREQVSAHGGFEVKTQGDGFMVAFPSARRAVDCSRAIQRAVARRLGDHPDGPIRLRIGLHTGEAIREADDFYGRNVVFAARVAGEARGGEILASEVVKQLTESAGDIDFAEVREVDLKGLSGPHRVYRIAVG